MGSVLDFFSNMINVQFRKYLNKLTHVLEYIKKFLDQKKRTVIIHVCNYFIKFTTKYGLNKKINKLTINKSERPATGRPAVWLTVKVLELEQLLHHKKRVWLRAVFANNINLNLFGAKTIH